MGLSCEGKAFVTRLFYANIIVNTPSEEFGFTTHILGHQLKITPSILAKSLDIPQEGHKVDPLNPWNYDGERLEYLSWIMGNREIPNDQSLSLHHLPAVHQTLLFLVHNVLLGNSILNLNIEHNTVYFLRSLIEMDKKIDIPFLIVANMLNAAHSKTMSLPYSHLIFALIGINTLKVGTTIPSVNLITLFSQTKWKYAKFSDGSTIWFPNDDPENLWIKYYNAQPNQYTEPIGFTCDHHQDSDIDDDHISDSRVPHNQTKSSCQLPVIDSQDEVITQINSLQTWITTFDGTVRNQFSNLNSKQFHLENRANALNQRMDNYNARFDNLNQFAISVQTNWEQIYGSWKQPPPVVDEEVWYTESSDEEN